MKPYVSAVGLATLCTLSISGCARTVNYLRPAPAAASAAGSVDAATATRSDLAPARIRQLEDAPPPKVEGLGTWEDPPVVENPVARRAKGRELAIGGAIATGFGTLMFGAGALLFWGPVSCDLKKNWFCDLSQRVAGVGFMGAGALPIGIGTIVLAVGAYRARQSRSEAGAARAVQVAQTRE